MQLLPDSFVGNQEVAAFTLCTAATPSSAASLISSISQITSAANLVLPQLQALPSSITAQEQSSQAAVASSFQAFTDKSNSYAPQETARLAARDGAFQTLDTEITAIIALADSISTELQSASDSLVSISPNSASIVTSLTGVQVGSPATTVSTSLNNLAATLEQIRVLFGTPGMRAVVPFPSLTKLQNLEGETELHSQPWLKSSVATCFGMLVGVVAGFAVTSFIRGSE